MLKLKSAQKPQPDSFPESYQREFARLVVSDIYPDRHTDWRYPGAKRADLPLGVFTGYQTDAPYPQLAASSRFPAASFSEKWRGHHR